MQTHIVRRGFLRLPFDVEKRPGRVRTGPSESGGLRPLMSPQVLAELLGKPVSLNDLLFLLLPHIFTPFYVPEVGKDVEKKTAVAPVEKKNGCPSLI